ncbi:adenosylcobinamide-GDP ribazoletransferase [Sulfurimonas paralvinellae]|uniref:Adenosylcobinamide-GDP ribazoletransferase n=1 Tax=Sulfurimonas paralvinellae TaxID=317658 RepID=A0A7M1B5A0_9BACT|nr:adenosylcobinamide-GDP ribazoletransferase [Sulfurimonas paralvinellae]QOP44825.1 adenosylcobinamide-GDP ribazoletransferase [Sulfurimonas paralvinellae]
MSKVLKGFALSLSMLTTLPFFRVHDFYKGINGYAVMFYPLVGFILGSVLYGVYALLMSYFPHFHLAAIIFALWVVLTGALHLDGFADTIDGLFVPKERALEVMKDPHNGGMGVTFSVVFLILKASSLVALPNYAYALLPLVLLLPRLMIVFCIYFFPYVSGGMSTIAKEELQSTQVFMASLYSLLFIFLYNGWFLLIGAVVLLLLVKRFFIKRYGGFTGDIYGFTIEVTELLLLNLIILGLA